MSGNTKKFYRDKTCFGLPLSQRKGLYYYYYYYYEQGSQWSCPRGSMWSCSRSGSKSPWVLLKGNSLAAVGARLTDYCGECKCLQRHHRTYGPTNHLGQNCVLHSCVENSVYMRGIDIFSEPTAPAVNFWFVTDVCTSFIHNNPPRPQPGPHTPAICFPQTAGSTSGPLRIDTASPLQGIK